MEGLELSKILGISDKKALDLKSAGIDSPEKFLASKKELIHEVFQQHSTHQISHVYKMIKLYKERKFLVKKGLSLPNPSNVIFFDLESDPYNSKKIFLASFATNTEEPKIIFKDFTDNFYKDIYDYLIKQTKSVLLSSSGNNWDFTQLSSNFSKIYKDKSSPLLKFQGIDFNKLIDKAVISPVGISIKKFSQYLNFQPDKNFMNDKRVKSYIKQYNLQGQSSKQGYIMSIIYKKKKYKPDFISALLEYNKLDVERLRHIYRMIYKVSSSTNVLGN